MPGDGKRGELGVEFRYAAGNELVPLRRAIEMNLDDLFRIGDVVPLSVGLPTFGHHLNQNTAQRWLGKVGDAIFVCFDVLFRFLVLDEVVLFGFDVDAGIVNGFVSIATSDLDGEAGDRGRIFFWRSALLGENQRARGSEEKTDGSTTKGLENLHGGSKLSSLET